MLRSWTAVDAVDLRFNKNGLLVATINPTVSVKDPEQALTLLETLSERLRVIPGIKAVSYVRWRIPYSGADIQVRGANAQTQRARVNYIGPDYLRALGARRAQ